MDNISSRNLSESQGLFTLLVGDGRPLISLTGLCLALSGCFALFQSATGHFLPHDVAYLKMSPEDLCNINECRIVHFMFHDRVSFGGALIAIAVLYLWLAADPLKAGKPWAWWTLLASGVSGFGSFLSYLGYGYLDSWHAIATIGLLPCFVVGLYLSRQLVNDKNSTRSIQQVGTSWIRPVGVTSWQSQAGIGRACLLFTAMGMIGAGMTISVIGMTEVFVPSDLTFMVITRKELDNINPRLIPLIAHDRAGFGGAVGTAGILLFSCVWHEACSRALWQGLFIAGIAGWSTSIGIHPLIGYTDPFHLAPAVVGALIFFTGLMAISSEVINGDANYKT